LDKKLKDKKIGKEICDEKLWQFDNIIEGQIDNEVAKAIERAHSYHFNLQNYRSSLSDEQIKDWQETLKGVEIKNDTKIEKRYQELQKADPKTTLQILASFDVQNALQMDIARENLSRLDKKVLEKADKLWKLEEILRKGFQYPIVPLDDLIIVNSDKIRPADFPEIEFTVLGVSNQTGVFINEKLKGADIRQGYFKVYKNQFCYNPYRINVGSIGFSEFDIENQIISGAYNIFGCNESELNPKYLDALFKTKKFLNFVNEKANGGVRMDFKIESMQEWQIPLPPLEIQNEIVGKVEKQKQIIDGAEKIERGWKIDINFDSNIYQKVEMGSLVETSMYGTSNKAEYQKSGYPVLRIGNIGFCEFDLLDIKNVELESKEFKKLKLNKGDFLIVRSNGNPDLVGKCAVWDKDDTYVYASYLIRFIFDTNKIIPRFAMYYFMSPMGRVQLEPKQGGGTYNINSEEFKKFPISLPPLETQRQIVEKLDRQMQALEGVRLLKSEAEKRIEEILAGVWGE